MTPIQHLDHLNLTVEDLDETIAWYGRIFGFELVERGTRNGVRWAILRAGEALLCAYEQPGRRVPDDEEWTRGGRHGVKHFGLRCRDRAAWERTLEREALPTHWNSPVRYPHSTSWYVTDPTGYEIEVAVWDEGQARFG